MLYWHDGNKVESENILTKKNQKLGGKKSIYLIYRINKIREVKFVVIIVVVVVLYWETGYHSAAAGVTAVPKAVAPR